MIRRTRVSRVWLLGVALLGISVAGSAAAKRGPGWVPYRAWKAVERTAKAQLDPSAKLFKTDATKAQSMGLKGAKSGAWIVGARRTSQAPGQGIMPHIPMQNYYVVTKNKRGHWKATQLAGMGGYLSKVDALSVNPKVHVGVAGNPTGVCHGVEVSNATRLAVTKGKALATKSQGRNTQVVYLKGEVPLNQMRLGAEANIAASPPSVGWCGTVVPRNIPVSITPVMF